MTWTGASTAAISRRDPDGTSIAVAYGSPVALAAGAATLYDYESPFGVPVTYEAAVGSATASSGAATLAVDQVWLRHPSSPTLSMPVELSSDGEPSYPAARARLSPYGRARAIVITDGRRKAKSATLGVRTFTLDERARLLALLDDCAVLLLDVPPAFGWRLSHQYMAIDTATAAPIVPSRPATPWDEWSLPYDVVDRPVFGTAAPWTYAALLAGYASYDAVKATFPTYQALRDNLPSGSTGPVLPPVDPDLSATATTYTWPAGIPSQSVYAVTVNGAASYVHPTHDNPAITQPHWGKFTHWSQTAGTSEVIVTTNYDVTNVRVRPTIEAITATILTPRTVKIMIPRTGNYSVEFNADPTQTDQSKPGSTNQLDPLFLFVSPPESKPSKTDPNVALYLEEGQLYTAGSTAKGNGSTVTIAASGDFVVPDGKKVYIEGGAYFKGRLICGASSSSTGGTPNTTTFASNISVDGRGVVDATWQSTSTIGGAPGNPLKVYKCSDTTVSYLTFLNCNKWATRVFGSGALGPVLLKGIRVLSWGDPVKGAAQSPVQDQTPDGLDIIASQNVTIDGVFLRARDDAIAMKANKGSTDGTWSGSCHDNLVQNCVIWNGNAGNCLEIGFETGGNGTLTTGSGNQIYNISYKHCDLIHKTTPMSGDAVPPAIDYARGAISIHNREAGNVHNISYEDIRIEDVIGDAGSTAGGKDGIIYIDSSASGGAIATTDIYLKDISVVRAQAALSIQVRGGGPTNRVVNVTFENLVINGTPIPDDVTAANNGFASSNVTNVHFVPSQGSGPTGGTLNPVADAWVQNNGLAANPVDQYLLVKNSSNNTLDREAFLRFDATASGLSTCSNAKLRLWKIRNDSGASTPITLYPVTDDTWTETAITWANRPAKGTALGSTAIAAQAAYYEWDVTAWVAANLAGDKLISFALADAGALDNTIGFNSKDAAANLPQLLIAP